LLDHTLLLAAYIFFARPSGKILLGHHAIFCSAIMQVFAWPCTYLLHLAWIVFGRKITDFFWYLFFYFPLSRNAQKRPKTPQNKKNALGYTRGQNVPLRFCVLASW
jgi:hypothetical protein